jgi:hypothetical protein
MLKCAQSATRRRVDTVEGFVGNASINVSLKKNSKKLDNELDAKFDIAIRLECKECVLDCKKKPNNRCKCVQDVLLLG